MRINHNIAALNTYRQLTTINNATQKSIEKLSSGLRINKAADDAAGLAISEKMRSQIRGLEQAMRNAQDGISLIQTAEGALNETHAILQRMRELAVQAANDTNAVSDRWELQKEINQLAEEITRIAENTEFNTKKLLTGTFNGIFQIGANQDQSIQVNVGAMTATALAVVNTDYSGAVDPGDSVVNAVTGIGSGLSSNAAAIQGGAYNVAIDTGSGTNVKFTVAINTVTGGTVTLTGSAAADAGSITIAGNTSYVMKFIWSGSASAGTSATVYIVGKGEGLSVVDKDDANAAMTALDKAIANVSAERSKLGAVQNRLEHTINNLGTAAENLTAAESRVRDVDMAREMMAFTKNNIISQAATAMLAQANMQPQLVLQLLQ